jgi:hypothetical protein
MVQTSNVSTITFRSDLPPTTTHHYTGILHGIKYTSTNVVSEEHVFCWINDASFIERAVEFLNDRDFEDESLVFVPYSSKVNWMTRYPFASVTLECLDGGEVLDLNRPVVPPVPPVAPAPVYKVGGYQNHPAVKPPVPMIPPIGKGKATTSKGMFLEKARGTLPTVQVVIQKRTRTDFDGYYQKLMEFKAEHGHVDVPVRYEKDEKLGKWVNSIRIKKKSLDAQGLQSEPPKMNKDNQVVPAGATTLTLDRIEKLNAIGMDWHVIGPTPRLSWEERFQELMEYFQVNGRWPPHTQGTLGEWVHKQRTKWAKRDEVFMRDHFHKLDAVGFKWKVRDRQTAVSWEQRFEQLAEFGKINGHFDVPNPAYDEAMGNYQTAEASRFYKWVNSLHSEYHAFKSEEGSKVLNDERVLQLIKLGFEFR